jgi:hypothetical protein
LIITLGAPSGLRRRTTLIALGDYLPVLSFKLASKGIRFSGSIS